MNWVNYMKLQPRRTDVFNEGHEIAKPIDKNIAVPRIFETFVSIHYFMHTWS